MPTPPPRILAAALRLCATLVVFFASANGARAQLAPTHADLVYAEVGGQSLRLDLYLPTCTALGTPLVVYIHGGGWNEGERAPIPDPVAALVASGIAVASVDYRLTSQAALFAPESVTFPAQIHDVKGAVRWLRAHAAQYCIDPERIAAWGHSAGGHLAALLGVTGGDPWFEGTVGGNLDRSSRVRAVVDYAATTDVLRVVSDIVPLSAGGPGSIVDHASDGSWEALILGVGSCQGTIDCDPTVSFADLRHHFFDVPEAEWPPAIAEKLALARALSPITHITDDDAPIFIAHGDADVIVPIGQSQRFVAALDQSAVLHTWRPLAGEGHRVFTTPAAAPIDPAARAFLAARMPIEVFFRAPRSYCFAGTNGDGHGAHLSWSGSTSLLNGNFTLRVEGVPPQTFGLFLMGSGRTNMPFENGIRCIGNPIVRLGARASNAAGRASMTLDFGWLPPNPANPGGTLLGSSFYLQYWYRDLGALGTSNLSDALDVQVSI